MSKTFQLIFIKPVRYDDDGYPIQWYRSVYPSFSLSLLNAMGEDCAERRVLGPDVDIVVDAYDDQCGVPPVSELVGRIKAASAGGLVAFVGAHTAQFPRAAALVRQFRAADVPVVIGGSHVSGTLASLPEPSPELQEMLDLGVSLFAGEAEGRFEQVLCDAYAGKMESIYNYGGQLVDMTNAILPKHVPENVNRRLALSFEPISPIEAGRGCPFKCTFCTVINVHGRLARARTAESVACFVRNSVANGRARFLFTDDNFARNENWKEILEALINLREQEGLKFSFVIQVDTQSDRIPGLIELAAKAGCVQVFVGMESINPDALRAVGKNHNAVKRYQRFFLAWKRYGIVTMVGYIIGFPNDTPESVRRDLATIKRELAIDLLYFFILTPLPGSADHATLWKKGVPLDPDPSRYTTFHTTIEHPKMTSKEWEGIYREAWGIFYDNAHSKTILQRHAALGGELLDLTPFMVVARNAFVIENINPAEFGFIRVKSRRERRPGLPQESLIPFMLRQGVHMLSSQIRWAWQWFRLVRLSNAVMKDTSYSPENDQALAGFNEPFIEENASGENGLELIEAVDEEAVM